MRESCPWRKYIFMAYTVLIKNQWNCNNLDESSVSLSMGYIKLHILLPEGAIRGQWGLIDANKQKKKFLPTESTNLLLLSKNAASFDSNQSQLCRLILLSLPKEETNTFHLECGCWWESCTYCSTKLRPDVSSHMQHFKVTETQAYYKKNFSLCLTKVHSVTSKGHIL